MLTVRISSATFAADKEPRPMQRPPFDYAHIMLLLINAGLAWQEADTIARECGK